jgi:hypothetical protein
MRLNSTDTNKHFFDSPLQDPWMSGDAIDKACLKFIRCDEFIRFFIRFFTVCVHNGQEKTEVSASYC